MRKLCILIPALCLGCGSGSDSEDPTAPPHPDAAADSTSADSSQPDAGSDASHDADSTADSPLDVAAEGIPINPKDASKDSPPDTELEAAPEASHDVVSEPLPDVVSEPLDEPGQDAPAEAAPDVSTDVGADVVPEAGPDVVTGPVDPGVYTYQIVQTYGLLNPPGAAFHPQGGYALVLNASDKVFSYDPATKQLSQVASAGSTVVWRTVTFTPDGSKAILLAQETSAKEGRVYLWDHATSALEEMQSQRTPGTTFEAIAYSPDGSKAKLLGWAKPTNYIAYLWDFDVTSGKSGVKATATSAGCQGLAWAGDSYGNPSVAVVCGINGAELLHLDGGGQFVVYSGNVGNTSRIAGRPQGDYALAVCNSCNSDIYRFELGAWDADYYSPEVLGGYQVRFNWTGQRALVLGGYQSNTKVGQVYEYRHNLYTQADIMNVSIPNFGLAPYNADGYVELNDVAFHPNCDGGIIVGGSNYTSSQKGYVIRFQVDNGIACE